MVDVGERPSGYHIEGGIEEGRGSRGRVVDANV